MRKSSDKQATESNLTSSQLLAKILRRQLATSQEQVEKRQRLLQALSDVAEAKLPADVTPPTVGAETPTKRKT